MDKAELPGHSMESQRHSYCETVVTASRENGLTMATNVDENSTRLQVGPRTPVPFICRLESGRFDGFENPVYSAISAHDVVHGRTAIGPRSPRYLGLHDVKHMFVDSRLLPGDSFEPMGQAKSDLRRLPYFLNVQVPVSIHHGSGLATPRFELEVRTF